METDSILNRLHHVESLFRPTSDAHVLVGEIIREMSDIANEIDAIGADVLGIYPSVCPDDSPIASRLAEVIQKIGLSVAVTRLTPPPDLTRTPVEAGRKERGWDDGVTLSRGPSTRFSKDLRSSSFGGYLSTTEKHETCS